MLLPILQVHTEDLPAAALVCGDPERAARIAERLEEVRELAFSREYRTFVGKREGVALAVVSHGVGSPGAAVCFEELIRGGVRTLIRVGTAGSYTEACPPGSLVISTAAVRAEGLTHQLVPPGFPAVADGAVVAALEAAAREVAAQEAGKLGDSREAAAGVSNGGESSATQRAGKETAEVAEIAVRKGITVTLDAFFTGVVELPHAQYKQAGACAVEMEIAALYIIAQLRGARAGAIVALDGYADADLASEYNPHTELVARAVDREIEIALAALVRLADE